MQASSKSHDFKSNHETYLSMVENFVHQKGDKGSELLSILGGYIRKFSYAKCFLSPDDQQDVLQEIAIKILNNHTKIIDNCYGWLFKISHNECINRIKKNSSSSALISMSASHEIMDVREEKIQLPALPDDITEAIDCFEYVFDEIVKQSGAEQDREIYFQYVLGSKNSEIASQTGRTEGAIAKRLTTLRVRVKQLFLKFC